MSNYNKVKNEGVEEFNNTFELESQGCSECGGTELIDKREIRFPKGKYYCEWDLKKIESFLSTFAEKVHKATLEDNTQELRNILNRCKTERGLGVAIANYIKTLTKYL